MKASNVVRVAALTLLLVGMTSLGAAVDLDEEIFFQDVGFDESADDSFTYEVEIHRETFFSQVYIEGRSDFVPYEVEVIKNGDVVASGSGELNEDFYAVHSFSSEDYDEFLYPEDNVEITFSLDGTNRNIGDEPYSFDGEVFSINQEDSLFTRNDDVILAAVDFNEPPEFESVESSPSPPQIGENVSYSAELFDPDDYSELEEVELELDYGGETVYTETRSVSGHSDSAEWIDVFTPEETEQWLNATFTVTDTAGDSTEESLDYFLDDTPPEVEIVEPENETYWSYDVPYEVEVDADNDAVPDQEFSLELYNDEELIETLEGTGTETFTGEFRQNLEENVEFEAVANDTGGETTETQTFSVKDLEIVETSHEETVFETEENKYEVFFDLGEMIEETQTKLVYENETVETVENSFDNEILVEQLEELEYRPQLLENDEERNFYFEVEYEKETFEGETETRTITSNKLNQTIEEAFTPEEIQLEFDFDRETETVEKHSFDYMLEFEDQDLDQSEINMDGETMFNETTDEGLDGNFLPGNVDTEEDKDVESNLIVEFKDRTVERSFPTETITIHPVNLNTDSDGAETLELEVFDEENQDENVEAEIEFNLDVTTSENELDRNFGFTETGETVTVYLEPEWVEVQVTGPMVYSAENYRNREYQIFNETLSESVQSIDLYLLDSDLAEPVYFEVLDGAGDPVEDATLSTLRYSTGTNSYVTVSRVNLDSEGTGLAYLNIDDVYYKNIVTREGEVLREFDREQITCASLPCEISLSVEREGLEYFQEKEGFTYECNPMETDGNFTGVQCTVDHESDLMQQAELKIERSRGLGNVEVCESSTGTAGSLVCEIDENPDGNRYTYTLTGYTDNNQFILDRDSYDFTTDRFQGEAGFWAVLIFLSITLLGLKNYSTAIMFAVFGATVSWALGFLAVSLSSIAGLIIVAGIYIFVHRE